MTVGQIAVFLENKKGRLEEMTKILGDAGIDLAALTIADTSEFGIVRFITRDNVRVLKLLKDNGYTASQNPLLGVEVRDVPGGLHKVLKLLGDKEVNVEYLYSFARSEKDKAVILFKVSDTERAETVLKENGVKLLESIF